MLVFRDRYVHLFSTKSTMPALIVLGLVMSMLGRQAAAVSPNESIHVSFEQGDAGEFSSLQTSVGTWFVEDGRALVDARHAKRGKQCLHLAGGTETVATLRLSDGVDPGGVLTFWAERWTSRSPFRFRIEKESAEGWQEIYNGDNQIRVGRSFLNQVKVELGDKDIRQLRFRCSSPSDTGVLIDEVRISPARPMKVVDVRTVDLTLPALKGSDRSPLVRLEIEAIGNLQPTSIQSVVVDLKDDGQNMDPSGLFVTREDGPQGPPWSWERTQRLDRGPSAQSLDQHPSAVRRILAPEANEDEADAGTLDEGVNRFLVACHIRDDADIDDEVGLRVREVVFSDGSVFKLDAPVSTQRLGVAVRQAGQDGVHTCRIPGLATTLRGTLIGVYDARHRGGGDLPGDIDVGMSRSTDGGQSWEPMKIIMDMGDDPKWNYDGIGDPAVLVDQQTGTIWVAATWSHGNRSWRGSGPGMLPEETGQLMLVRSDDDGQTWSPPINITDQVKRPEWCFLLQGPGKGITMRDGTLVFAAQYQDPPEKKRLPHSTILYSKDHGQTWHCGEGAFDDTTEAQVIEVEPGVLMLNCRYNRESTRIVMTSDDLGATWQEHETSRRDLIEPRTCMASLIDVDRELGKIDFGAILFSNPNSTSGRDHITIKTSFDRGKSWPQRNQLLLDEGSSAGYSCMSMIDEETVGILYEGSQAHMSFQRIPLIDLLGRKSD